MTVPITDRQHTKSKTGSKLDSRRKALVAYHEAGHAVMAIRRGVEIDHVSIAPSAGSLGRTITLEILKMGDVEWGNSPEATGRIENYIVIVLAGPYAQKRHRPKSSWLVQHDLGPCKRNV